MLQIAMLLIVGPFVLLILGIIVYALIRRGNRRLQPVEERMLLEPAGPRPSDHFHDQTWLPLCERIEIEWTKSQPKPLTRPQRQRIWRSSTQLALESLLAVLESTPQQAEQMINRLPSGVDRPDLSGWIKRGG